MLFRQNLPELKSKIRILHGLVGLGNVDVYLSGNLVGKDLAFSDVTCYENIAPDSYEFQIYNSGTYDNPIMSRKIDIAPSTNITVAIIENNNRYNIIILNDATVKGKATITFLRFINLSINAPLMTLSLPNDIRLFDNVEYSEITGYYPLSPAIYDFKISFASIAGLYKFINDKTLKNGRFYTIYIIGLLNKKPEIGYILLEDGEL